MIVLNLLIVGAVLRYPSLRQRNEYLVVSALAVADASLGSAYFTSGIYRSWLICHNQHKILVSTWECMQKLHCICFLFGSPIASAMLVCTSLDRLLAVLFPVWYFKSKSKYSKVLIGVSYGIAWLNSLSWVGASFYFRNDPKRRYAQICLASSALGKGFISNYYYFVRFGCGVTSVGIYLFIPFLYGRIDKGVGTKSDREQKAKARRQKKLMKTLGISAFFTFILFVVPNAIKSYWVDYMPTDVWEILSPYLSCIQNLNCLMNFFLYTLRHEDIRNGVLSLIKMKSTIAVAPSAAVASLGKGKAGNAVRGSIQAGKQG